MSDISGHFSHGFRLLSTTAEQLPDIDCDYIIIKALSTNGANLVFIGNSNVTNTVAADNLTTGIELGAGEQIKLEVPNANRIWAVASAATPGITFIAVR
jgi:hypothetical protein